MNKSQMLQDMILNEMLTGHYRSGEAIPSRNQLCRKFKCSRNTVERAIAVLKEKGYLVSNQGGSTRVVLQQANLNGNPVPLKELFVISGIQHEYSDRAMREIFFPDLDSTTTVRAVREGELLRCMDALARPGTAVIWITPDISSLYFMAHLERLHVPQLLINRHYLHYDSAGTDTRTSLHTGLEWLVRTAGKQCAVVSGSPDLKMPYLSERLITFYEEAAAFDIRLSPSRIHVQDLTDLPAQLSAIGGKLFAKGKPPRGIIILDARMTVPLVTLGHMYGKTPGVDYFILTYDYHPELVQYQGIGMLRQQYEVIYRESLRWFREGAAAAHTPFHADIPAELLFGSRLSPGQFVDPQNCC